MNEGQVPEQGSEVQMGLCLHFTNLSPLYSRFALETSSEGCLKQHRRASQLFSTMDDWGVSAQAHFTALFYLAI